MAAKPLTNLEALENEIVYLQARSRQLEDVIDDNFKYLQENHLSMVVKSVIPKRTGARTLLITVLGIIFQNERFQGKVNKMLDDGIDKIVNLFDRLFSKKKE